MKTGRVPRPDLERSTLHRGRDLYRGRPVYLRNPLLRVLLSQLLLQLFSTLDNTGVQSNFAEVARAQIRIVGFMDFNELLEKGYTLRNVLINYLGVSHRPLFMARECQENFLHAAVY